MYQVPPATGLDRSQLNPWLSMWTAPRATIRAIVESDPRRHVLLLAVGSGVSQTLNNAATQGLGDRYSVPAIFILSLMIGSIFGIIQLYIGGALLRWSGSWLGGTASATEVRAAIAWSAVPSIWMLGLWAPELLIFGRELFTTASPRLDSHITVALAFLFFGVIELVVSIWSLVILLKSLGEVHGFSAWRALAACLLPVLALAILVVAVLSIVG